MRKENGRDGIGAFRAKDGVSKNKPAGEEGSLDEWRGTASGIRLVDCENVVVTGNRCIDTREQKWQVFGLCVEGRSRATSSSTASPRATGSLASASRRGTR